MVLLFPALDRDRVDLAELGYVIQTDAYSIRAVHSEDRRFLVRIDQAPHPATDMLVFSDLQPSQRNVTETAWIVSHLMKACGVSYPRSVDLRDITPSARGADTTDRADAIAMQLHEVWAEVQSRLNLTLSDWQLHGTQGSFAQHPADKLSITFRLMRKSLLSFMR